MGHYRSEMGFEEEDRKAAERDAAQRKLIQSNLRDDIAARGIDSVLAELIADARKWGIYIGTAWTYKRDRETEK